MTRKRTGQDDHAIHRPEPWQHILIFVTVALALLALCFLLFRWLDTVV